MKTLPRSNHREFSPLHGFTLIELLVVLGITGILFAITLPAVQSARESARKTGCTNNLRQVALAVHHFEARHTYFPPAFTNSDLKNPTRKKHNIISFLLADLEQQNLADQYSFEYHWFEALRPTPETSNRKLAETPIEGLKCPSSEWNEYAAASDYAVCTQISPRDHAARSRLLKAGLIRPRKQWVSMLYSFGENTLSGENTGELRRVRRRQIGDGLSHSMMLFEDAGRPALYVAGRRVTGSGKEPLPGALWADSEAEFSIHDVCNNSLMNCNNGDEIYSFHISGCNFAFGDGSIRFLHENIDPDLFVSLFTSNAGDVAFFP